MTEASLIEFAESKFDKDRSMEVSLTETGLTVACYIKRGEADAAKFERGKFDGDRIDREKFDREKFDPDRLDEDKTDNTDGDYIC